LSKCTAITRGGERCKGIAIDSSGYCYAHHPDHADARRQAASKGGKRGGRSRPRAELSEAKVILRGLAGRVLNGSLQRSDAAVAAQVMNVYLRALSLELKIREQEELTQRLESLEEALEHQKETRRYGA
jgi:hypothetical protein